MPSLGCGGMGNNPLIFKERLKAKVMSEFKTRVRMTASEFVKQNGGKLDLVKNPNTNKIFFVCGTKRGYVSQKVCANMGNLTLDQLGYAEVEANINGKEEIVPTLFLASSNVVKSFSL